jgi:hypothetical protein
MQLKINKKGMISLYCILLVYDTLNLVGCYQRLGGIYYFHLENSAKLECDRLDTKIEGSGTGKERQERPIGKRDWQHETSPRVC